MDEIELHSWFWPGLGEFEKRITAVGGDMLGPRKSLQVPGFGGDFGRWFGKVRDAEIRRFH
jgi:hypothetical protein